MLRNLQVTVMIIKTKHRLIVIFLFSVFALLPQSSTYSARDVFSQEPLSKKIVQKIIDKSWKTNAPVQLEDLSYLKITYFGFDGKVHIGEMIVHKKVAAEVLEIFRELYHAGFAIEKMNLVDLYDADDKRSMKANNSSSLNVRPVTGNNKAVSMHSYGLAIDINPLRNPSVNKNEVLPPTGREFLDRKKIRKGMITKGDLCYKAFVSRGWQWGGDWKSVKDYQHFEKK
jgi:hypothetical protein